MPAEHFVELGVEGVNHLIDKHWDRGYHAVHRTLHRKGFVNTPPLPPAPAAPDENTAPHPPPPRSSSPSPSDRLAEDKRRQHKNSLPTPETDIPNPLLRQTYSTPRNPNIRMSTANGGLAPQTQQQRSNSAQPPRSRYYDDDDDYGSDYDDRYAHARRSNGRGYDRGYDDGYEQDNRPYEREVIETERYKGPARDFDQRRQSFRSNDPYGPGAVTQYNRRGGQDDDYYSSGGRRSRSRGASRGRRDDSRDRSYSRSRSRSRGGERGFQQKVGSHFDTSLQGIGVGIAGAVVGGMAGRHFGERNPRHKNRDILLGTIVGAVAANAAETKWRHWMDEKKERVHEDEEKYEQRYDGGRSRSAMR